MPKETPGETEFPQSRSLQQPSFSVVLGKPITENLLDANYLQNKRNVYVQAEIQYCFKFIVPKETPGETE